MGSGFVKHVSGVPRSQILKDTVLTREVHQQDKGNKPVALMARQINSLTQNSNDIVVEFELWMSSLVIQCTDSTGFIVRHICGLRRASKFAWRFEPRAIPRCISSWHVIFACLVCLSSSLLQVVISGRVSIMSPKWCMKNFALLKRSLYNCLAHVSMRCKMYDSYVVANLLCRVSVSWAYVVAWGEANTLCILDLL